jgi:hypothetical protein
MTMNQTEAFVHFMCKMDIEMLDLILNDKLTYQDLQKEDFLKEINELFEAFKALGNTELIASMGYCKFGKCGPTKNGFAFYGNKTPFESAAYIIQNDSRNRIEDVYLCTSFSANQSTLYKSICKN